ncbi:hypothetical protein GMOD_00009175 [Pyrenophora seminiperda CCB06]|uniref:Uncharacterized protein n=1 Tax=Pyrenophora seminiperda CCB06 TaxID=1302712 RepID=A0A3M7MBJ6_9PLEO|nr:hypothetical protein GMOD_00009175 [Pyrenophora seminiperda CCB06]
MAGILCVWANVDKDAVEFYENTVLPQVRNPNFHHSIHCEITASGMENEPVGKLDSPWPYLTVFETRDVETANKDIVDKTYTPPDEVMNGVFKESRFDTRTYRELKRWQDEEWKGEGGSGKMTSPDEGGAGLMNPEDIEDVACVTAMEWSIVADKEADVLKYYMEVVGPLIAQSPDVLRFRLFQVDSATTIQGNQYTQKESKKLHKFFTMVELASEEWPWDVVVELAEDEQWKAYFDTDAVVKWQVSNFLVKQAYHEDNTKTPPHE